MEILNVRIDRENASETSTPATETSTPDTSSPSLRSATWVYAILLTRLTLSNPLPRPRHPTAQALALGNNMPLTHSLKKTHPTPHDTSRHLNPATRHPTPKL
eukprot:991262-Amorphochlora_amoeboformis.AAC.2